MGMLYISSVIHKGYILFDYKLTQSISLIWCYLAPAYTTSTPRPGICPSEEWLEFGGHCYYFGTTPADGEDSPLKTWEDANERYYHITQHIDYSSALLCISQFPVLPCQLISFNINQNKKQHIPIFPKYINECHVYTFRHSLMKTQWLCTETDCLVILNSLWNVFRCTGLSGKTHLGHLVSIHSDAENSFVFKELQRRADEGQNVWMAWIGLKEDTGSG